MWAQIVNIILGFWLIISPSVLGLSKDASNNDRIIGPIVVTIAFIALSESMRNIRYFNILFGVWLLISPWILNYDEVEGIFNDMGTGGLVVILSLIKGTLKNTFGGGWRSLLQHNPLHIQEANIQKSKAGNISS